MHKNKHMNKNKIFFGSEGLTSTSANHIANLAKESYQALEEKLSRIQLYNESISLLGTIGETPISKGVSETDLNCTYDMLAEIVQLKSLIAWLREAIKARKALSEELDDVELVDYCAARDIDYPMPPERERDITEDDYYASLGIRERNAYYALETKCAVIGKYIHESGPLNCARRKLAEIISNPNTIRDSGRDTTIISRTPSVSTEAVDDLFFRLQVKWREYQASLNAIKHKCDLALEEDQLRKTAEYNAAFQAYSLRREELMNEMKAWKEEQTVALQQLKIVIPDSLKPVYERVCKLGK